MRKICLFVCVACLFANELEVDGNLTVTGDINSPTIDSLSGMKPERIYRYEGIANETKGLTVPDGKIWLISSALPKYSAEIWINFQGEDESVLAINKSGVVDSQPIYMLSGDIFSIFFGNLAIINIFEYSISGSGSDQGMDYIEP